MMTEACTASPHSVSKAEQVLPEVLALHAEAHDAVVAVLDPPRAGLSPTAIQQLLINNKVQRIVYVSCSLETLAANIADFCGAPQVAKRKSLTWSVFLFLAIWLLLVLLARILLLMVA